MRAFALKHNLLDEVYCIPLAHVSKWIEMRPECKSCTFSIQFSPNEFNGQWNALPKNETWILSGDPPIAIVCCAQTMVSAINSYSAIALCMRSHIYWPIKCKWMQPHSLSGSFAIGCSKNVERIAFWFLRSRWMARRHRRRHKMNLDHVQDSFFVWIHWSSFRGTPTCYYVVQPKSRVSNIF